jgi:hypothetical protein
MENVKTVFEQGGVKIVREQGYGFRCNSLSTSWSVYKDGQTFGSYSTLKRAKKWAEALVEKSE